MDELSSFFRAVRIQTKADATRDMSSQSQNPTKSAEEDWPSATAEPAMTFSSDPFKVDDDR
jgi:hypothetical protein